MNCRKLIKFYNQNLSEWRLVYKDISILTLSLFLIINSIGAFFISYTIVNWSYIEITIPLGLILSIVSTIAFRLYSLKIINYKINLLQLENQGSFTLNINQIREKFIKEYVDRHRMDLDFSAKKNIIDYLNIKSKQKDYLYIHTWITVIGLILILHIYVLVTDNLILNETNDRFFFRILSTIFVFIFIVLFSYRFGSEKLFKRRNRYRNLLGIINRLDF